MVEPLVLPEPLPITCLLYTSPSLAVILVRARATARPPLPRSTARCGISSTRRCV